MYKYDKTLRCETIISEEKPEQQEPRDVSLPADSGGARKLRREKETGHRLVGLVARLQYIYVHIYLLVIPR